MDIEVEIGSVAIEGFDSVDRVPFVEALQRGLRDQLGAPPPSEPGHGPAAGSGAEIEVAGRHADADVGRQVAAAVARRLRSQWLP